MENDVRQRIKLLLDSKNISINAISKSTGYPQSNLNKQINSTTSISLNTVLVVLDYITDASGEWLLRGTGEMLLTEQSLQKSKPIDSNAEAEIEKLKMQVARLEGQNDLLREQIGMAETKRSKTA